MQFAVLDREPTTYQYVAHVVVGAAVDDLAREVAAPGGLGGLQVEQGQVGALADR